jgi:hypothetical protein
MVVTSTIRSVLFVERVQYSYQLAKLFASALMKEMFEVVETMDVDVYINCRSYMKLCLELSTGKR